MLNLTLLFFLLLTGCSRMEQSEREKIRRANCKSEPIYRNHDDHFCKAAPLVHTPRAAYPWESETNLPRITKEFFRCKGNPINPQIIDPLDPEKKAFLSDCEGCTRHGLPIIHGKENIYPILIDLLNYIQKKTGKRVVITSAHRCPAHNAYADPSTENRVSKHQIGAEVDFYVQGMEERPLEIIGYIMQYYVETDRYKKLKEYVEFKRFEKTDLEVQPWMNKEVFVKCFQKHEGRDLDNRHPNPYICIQVRHDLEKDERVVYEWGKANKGYPRS